MDCEGRGGTISQMFEITFDKHFLCFYQENVSEEDLTPTTGDEFIYMATNGEIGCDTFKRLKEEGVTDKTIRRLRKY